MRNRSIILKIFIILVVSFTFFIGIILFFQTSYFEEYYLKEKNVEIKKNLHSFINLYENSTWNKQDLKIKTRVFEQTNNVKIGIFDKSNRMLNEDIYEISIEDYSGEIFKIQLNALISNENTVYPEIQIGSIMNSEGYILEDSKFYPYKIDVNGKNWIDMSLKYFYDIENKYPLKISGTVVNFVMPSFEDRIRGINTKNLWGALDYWNTIKSKEARKKLSENNDGYFTFVYNNNYDNSKNTIIVSKVNKSNKEYTCLVYETHSSVVEAIKVLKKYYVLIFGGAFILVCIISIVFSFLIANPLIHIDKMAKKMAKLDFDEKIKVNSNDEIGSISRSLNILSSNLKKSIDDLTEANLKLKKDVDRGLEHESMRKDFISSISHELKTPLGIIKGYSEGIKDEIDIENTDKYIDIILDEVDKMDNLINDMLDLSKLTLGYQELVKTTFCINELIHDTSEKFNKKILEKNIKFNYSSNGIYYDTYSDKRRIEQVITNLLSNAIRYTYSSTVINIILEKDLEDPERVLCRINNETNVISDEALNKIWEKFYRIEKSRNKVIAGTGLGLAIVKNILEIHGCSYGVRKIDGRIEFYFTLNIVGESR
ncbi:sensor histidine kinase [Helicovermis profundi]|uniref:histidine kinase n=1 Tax=Helicovermis profundi TaxID=3065157 RepID=A0AAU9EF10_9FIRM|nr:HAMP domain-containing sensor histidine kinase [Clostridia bacterium S502]